MQDRLQILLECLDPEISILRQAISGCHEKYDMFWKAMNGIFHENDLQAVDSRSHG